MNWKTRQMFSDREHGIVSGLSPINMRGGGPVPLPGYQDGGVLPQLSNNYHTHPELHSHGSQQQVPGSSFRFPEDIQLFSQEGMRGGGPVPLPEYQEGGPVPSSINDQVAALAAKMGISPVEARGMILRGMVEKRGGTLSDDIINQFAQGTITLHEALAQINQAPVPKMQTGGIVPLDLFEEGDQDINQALNMMSGAVSPSLSDVGPTAPIGATETIEETVTVTEDQGSDEYQVEMQGMKNQFKELLRRYAAKLAEANGTIEQLIEQAKSVEIAFANKVAELQAKHNIEGLDETLLTEEFMQELTALIDPTIPGMQGAGVVHSQEDLIKAQKLLGELGINMSAQRFLDLPEEQRNKYVNAFTILSANRGVSSSSVGDRTKLDSLLKRREELAKEIGEAARSSYTSYGGSSVGHYQKALSAGKRAELEAMDQVLADQINTEKSLLSNARGSGVSSMGKLPARVIEDIYGNKGDLSASYEDMIDALKKSGTATKLDLVDVMFMERYQQMPPDQAAYQGTKTIQGQTVTFPEFYASTRKQALKNVDKVPESTYENRKIAALKKIFRLWNNA